MSQSKTIEFECPKCKQKQDTVVWEGISATVTPSAKEELLRGKVNIFQCSNCASEAFLNGDLYYNDMEKKYFVRYCPIELLEDERFLEDIQITPTGIIKFKSTLEESRKIPKQFQKEMSYMLNPHIVFDMQELIRYVIFRDRLFEMKQTKEEQVQSVLNEI